MVSHLILDVVSTQCSEEEEEEEECAAKLMERFLISRLPQVFSHCMCFLKTSTVDRLLSHDKNQY